MQEMEFSLETLPMEMFMIRYKVTYLQFYYSEGRRTADLRQAHISYRMSQEIPYKKEGGNVYVICYIYYNE